ncbi:Cellulose synthase-like protein [Drosera capensis]
MELHPSSPGRPLHSDHLHPLTLLLRLHTLLHAIAILALLYQRLTSPFTPLLPSLLITLSELLLSFTWLLSQPVRWTLRYRTPHPARLPDSSSSTTSLPGIDVFICTADPRKEPTVDVMSTVVSAMGLEYPTGKVNVYVGDDGGAEVTVVGLRAAREFARRWWLPFCRRWGVKCRSPKAYFREESEVDGGGGGGEEFDQDRRNVKEKYEAFVDLVVAAMRTHEDDQDENNNSARDHPPHVQVINGDDEEEDGNNEEEVPMLVYVAREKRPSHPHNFKAGSLNVLLRVSALMSNAEYILVLDCDMYCNDPSSARQAMCFHLDPKLSSSLAFVQFPQKFYNASRSDIYDSVLKVPFELLWRGMDGLRGPCLSGTGFYIKRIALYGSLAQRVEDPVELRHSFGPSNKFIKSLLQDQPNTSSTEEQQIASPDETLFVASCDYEKQTKWGQEATRPQFLGTAATNLNDVLIQGTRWSAGLVEVSLSKYCPLFYNPSRMSFAERMTYAWVSIYPLCYSSAMWILTTIPQLCLFYGISLYPKVSDPLFGAFAFIFMSSMLRNLYEILMIGWPARSWLGEQRMWMIKSLTSSFYGSLDAIMKSVGLRQTSFVPTNKVEDPQQKNLYLMDMYDFQTSNLYLIPIVSAVFLSVASFLLGTVYVIMFGTWENLLAQLVITGYISCMSYPVIEAMVLRTDNGRIPLSTSIDSAAACIIFLGLGAFFLL